MAGSKQQPADPVADAIARLNKQYGAGTVIRLGDSTPEPVDAISTGSIRLDAALGIGGLPRGRVSEIFGPEASGKTTIALEAIANAQKRDLRAALVDAEHALDPIYAKALGVDTDALHLNQPGSGEEGLEVVDVLVQTGGFGIIVIDSVAALVPQAEIDGEMGDQQIGLQARLLSKALRKLTAHVAETNTACVFINQLRSKVGFVMGSPDTTTGGRALPFFASVRLDARGIETLKDGAEAIGRRTRVKVVKNKLSAPFRSAEFDILFGLGINREGELLDLGELYQVLRKAGAHYFWDQPGAEPLSLGNGRAAARQTLMAEPELAKRLEAEVRQASAYKLPAPAVPEQASALPPERGTLDDVLST